MTKSDQRRGDESMLYVVSYDIPDDRRRTRVHSALTGFGTWVQYSVFECFLDRKQRVLLEARLLKEIHQRQDTVRIYFTRQGGLLLNPFVACGAASHLRLKLYPITSCECGQACRMWSGFSSEIETFPLLTAGISVSL